MPFVRLSTENSWVKTSLEFITGPNLSVVVAPAGIARLTLEASMDRFEAVRDLLFDASLGYHPMADRGDMVSASIGVSNADISFDRRDGSYRLQYYAAYAKVDLTLAQARLGYAFDGLETYADGEERDPGTGWFFSVQGIIPLGE